VYRGRTRLDPISMGVTRRGVLGGIGIGIAGSGPGRHRQN
jgi:hypothetical protein